VTPCTHKIKPPKGQIDLVKRDRRSEIPNFFYLDAKIVPGRVMKINVRLPNGALKTVANRAGARDLPDHSVQVRGCKNLQRFDPQ
jgi:hypothetical protein